MLVMQPDGGTSASALTNGLASDHGPANISPVWSPDAQEIAFVSCAKDGTNCYLYVMNNDGSLVRQITKKTEEYGGVSWSPDGKTLVYASRFDPGGFPNLYTIPSDGSADPQQLGTDDLSGWWPSWSPDGKLIAYQAVGGGNTTINVVNADGTNSQALTGAAGVIDLDPVWSPDEKSIAFIRGSNNKYAVYMMDADGKNQKRLTDLFPDPNPKATEALKLPALAWSPDGSSIVFNTHKTAKWELDRVDVKNPLNVHRILIVSAVAYSPSWTSWQP